MRIGYQEKYNINIKRVPKRYISFSKTNQAKSKDIKTPCGAVLPNIDLKHRTHIQPTYSRLRSSWHSPVTSGIETNDVGHEQDSDYYIGARNMECESDREEDFTDSLIPVYFQCKILLFMIWKINRRRRFCFDHSRRDAVARKTRQREA